MSRRRGTEGTVYFDCEVLPDAHLAGTASTAECLRDGDLALRNCRAKIRDLAFLCEQQMQQLKNAGIVPDISESDLETFCNGDTPLDRATLERVSGMSSHELQRLVGLPDQDLSQHFRYVVNRVLFCATFARRCPTLSCLSVALGVFCAGNCLGLGLRDLSLATFLTAPSFAMPSTQHWTSAAPTQQINAEPTATQTWN